MCDSQELESGYRVLSFRQYLNEWVSLLPGGWPFAIVAAASFVASISLSMVGIVKWAVG